MNKNRLKKIEKYMKRRCGLGFLHRLGNKEYVSKKSINKQKLKS